MKAELLEKLVLFISLGLFFDKILIGEIEKKKISDYLTGIPRKETFQAKYFGFLKVAHAAIFNRFFSGGLLSFTFVRSATVVSVVSFVVVASLQVYYDPSIVNEVNWDVFQISIILIFLLFNILFDYVTIAQTKIFIEAAISSRKILNSSFLIFSDFIVSLNLFVLLYAFFIYIITSFLVSPVEELVFYKLKHAKERVVQAEGVPDYLMFLDRPSIFERLKFSGDFAGVLQGDGGPDDEERVRVFYEATFEPKPGEAERILLASLPNMNVEIAGGFQDYVDDAHRISRKIHGGRIRYPRPSKEDTEEEIESQPIQALRMKVRGPAANLETFDASYTQAFIYADRLEDGFPMSFSLESATLSLEAFVADISSVIPDFAPFAVCLIQDARAAGFILTAHSVDWLEGCDDFIVVKHSWRSFLTRDFVKAGRGFEDRIVPFNTLIITSMLPTIVFYVIVIFLAVASVAFHTIARWVKGGRKYFVRSPFAISGFLIGIVFGVISAF